MRPSQVRFRLPALTGNGHPGETDYLVIITGQNILTVRYGHPHGFTIRGVGQGENLLTYCTGLIALGLGLGVVRELVPISLLNGAAKIPMEGFTLWGK